MLLQPLGESAEVVKGIPLPPSFGHFHLGFLKILPDGTFGDSKMTAYCFGGLELGVGSGDILKGEVQFLKSASSAHLSTSFISRVSSH